MISRLTPHYVSLVYEATLRSFWRKDALRRFLRECSVPDSFVSTWAGDETKRAFLDRLFDALHSNERREEVFARMGKALIEQASFPDLEGWEDSAEKKQEARRAIQNLRDYVAEQEQQLEDLKQQADARKRFDELQKKTRKAQHDLEALSTTLNGLVALIGTQEGGYKFQDWFYDLMDYFDVTSRRPYTTDGRQIDGSITLKDTTYLVELKFTQSQSAADDIDSFIRKVTTKADNTMGIFVSMSGYSSVAISEGSRERTPVLLFDHQHIFHVLGGRMSFPELVDRVKRHAAQTGHGYLPVNEFGS